MQKRAYLSGVVLILILCGPFLPVEAQQKPSRQSSLEAYSKGDYELAYREFSELLVTYPKDPLYKYYSGVCLVRLKREPDKAAGLLQDAKQNVAVVRSIPPEVLFWLGRAQQMSGRFQEAIDSYNLYTSRSGKKAARDLGVPDFIVECNAGKGNIESIETGKPKPQIAEEVKKTPEKKDSVTVVPVVKTSAPREIAREPVSEDYDKLLAGGLRYQSQSDSIQKSIDIQRSGLEKLGYRERTELRSKIAVSQHLADSLQNLADSTFSVAQEIMNKTPFISKSVAPKDTSVESPADRRNNTSAALNTIKAEVKKDTMPVIRADSSKPAIPKQKQVVKDTIRTAAVKVPAAQGKSTVDVYRYFEINPKPVYKPGEKIKINPDVPPGLIYRIQVAVFKNPVAPSYFKGISPVYGFKSATSGNTVYYAGMFRRLADANKALASVRQKGFKDAFVSSFSEGKAVSAERAVVLEKEWGRKPFVTAATEIPGTKADTIPPTLIFRVEVMRSKKPVKDDVIEGIRKMAGTRGLETIEMQDGTGIYLIGTFITYESAAEYADLLVRNGYRESKVTAWLGKKEIPVESARELFQKL